MKGETSTLLERTRTIRLSVDEDERLDGIAQSEGLTVSQLIRRTLRRSLFLEIEVKNSPFEGQSRTDADGSTVGNTRISKAPPAPSRDDAVSNGRTQQAAG